MSRTIRRIVTGHDDSGRSIITEDGPPSRHYDGRGGPSLVIHEIWKPQTTPGMIDRQGIELPEAGLTLAPASDTRVRYFDMPVNGPGADFAAVFGNIGGPDAHIASEPHASFHRTRSFDYGIVIEGEIILATDEGETDVRARDIVVQRGTIMAVSAAGLPRAGSPSC